MIDDEGATKALNSSAARIIYVFVHSSYMLLHNLSYEVYRLPQTKQCDHQSDIISDFKSFRMCLPKSVALQCDLSAGKLKLAVIFSVAE